VFVTPGLVRLYGERYRDLAGARVAVIENGYDEEVFAPLDGTAAREGPLLPGTFTLLHSGVVYPTERDPTQFFQALRHMIDAGSLKPGELRVRLRASVHETLLAKLIDSFRVADIVELAAPIPYRNALQEMMRADGLLVLQAGNCNNQVPAKVYEYFRCRRPIFGLTDPAGDTAGVLRSAGIHNIARLDSSEEIALELRRFLDQAKRGEAGLPTDELIGDASRLRRTRELAGLLDQICPSAPE
jgi:hypothetical protein